MKIKGKHGNTISKWKEFSENLINNFKGD